MTDIKDRKKKGCAFELHVLSTKDEDQITYQMQERELFSN